MAAIEASSPSTNSRVSLSRATLSTGMTLAETVTSHLAVFSPSVVVTVIVAVPGATAVTLPSASTVATASSEVLHATDLSVASSGATVAASVASSPSTISRVSLSTVTPSTGMTFASTVTSHFAVFPPSVVVAVIVAVPAATAVTLPFSSTVATFSSEVLHANVLSEASSGATVAVSVASSPSTMERVSLSTVMPETGMTFASTVTSHFAVFPPSEVVTVMVADPAFTAVTFPPSTVATPVLEDDHETAWLVAFEGVTEAAMVSLPPSVRVKEVLLRETPVTATVVGPGGVGVISCSLSPQATTNSDVTAASMEALMMLLNDVFMGLLL